MFNKAFGVILLVAVLGYGCVRHAEAPASSVPGRPGVGNNVENSATDGQRVVGDYIVRGEASLERETLQALFGRYGIREIRDLGRSRFYLRLEDDPGLSAIRKTASGEAQIESVEPNLKYQVPEQKGGAGLR